MQFIKNYFIKHEESVMKTLFTAFIIVIVYAGLIISSRYFGLNFVFFNQSVQTNTGSTISGEQTTNTGSINTGSTNTGITNTGITAPIEKSVAIFEHRYQTKIDLTLKKDLEYRPNINNLKITLNGSIKSAMLNFVAETTIYGGDSIRREAPYYVFFAIDTNIPRVIGTDRLQSGNFSQLGKGIFFGRDMPKIFHWDISNLQLANAKNPPEGAGSKVYDFVELLNKNIGKTLPMTLFVGGGGVSQLDPDPKKRIYMDIPEAELRYICNNDSPDCSITIE